MNATEKNNAIQEINYSDLRDEYLNLPDFMRKVSFNFWMLNIVFGQLERNKELIAIHVMNNGERKYKFTIGRLKINR